MIEGPSFHEEARRLLAGNSMSLSPSFILFLHHTSRQGIILLGRLRSDTVTRHQVSSVEFATCTHNGVSKCDLLRVLAMISLTCDTDSVFWSDGLVQDDKNIIAPDELSFQSLSSPMVPLLMAWPAHR